MRPMDLRRMLKMTKTKRRVILTLLSVFLALAVCFGLWNGIAKEKANAENAKYTVTVNTRADGMWNVLVSRLPVSEGATYVTLKYKVMERTGASLIFAIGRGTFTNGVFGDASLAAWNGVDFSAALRVGATYSTIYYLDNPARNAYTSAVDENGNDILSSFPGFSANYSAGTATNDHFGLCYASSADTNVMSLKLEVECVDDKGKDLQLMNGGVANNTSIEGVISAPESSNYFTTAKKEDINFMRPASNRINGNPDNEAHRLASLVPAEAKYFENDEGIKGMGSKDGSIVMLEFGVTSPWVYSIHGLEFGRKIKYSDLSESDTLVLRFAQAGNPNIFLFSSSDDNRMLAQGILLNTSVYGGKSGFFDYEISYSDMAKIVDNNGYISGLTVVSAGNTEARMLIDEVYVKSTVEDPLSLEDGAYIRTADPYGIRFIVTVDVALLEALGENISVGVRFTSSQKEGHLDVEGVKYTEENGVRTYSFALVGFGEHEDLLNTEFTVQAYFEVNGVRTYHEGTVTRSVCGVATSARSSEATETFTRAYTDIKGDTYYYAESLTDAECQLISDIAAKAE